MPWNLDNDRPIYLQIIERISMDIVSGVYRAGDKLPSGRELAASAAVNPNTMQRAMADLEREGLVYSKRTSGRYITEDEAMLKKIKNELASSHITEFIEKMRQLGYQDSEILVLIKEKIKEE